MPRKTILTCNKLYCTVKEFGFQSLHVKSICLTYSYWRSLSPNLPSTLYISNCSILLRKSLSQNEQYQDDNFTVCLELVLALPCLKASKCWEYYCTRPNLYKQIAVQYYYKYYFELKVCWKPCDNRSRKVTAYNSGFRILKTFKL